MLRNSNAIPATRTFRDGFTVAEDMVRRTQTLNLTDRSPKKAVLPEESTLNHSENSVRMTTIKTEDGDEITIKRAATSKGNNIMTISRDDRGKLTIEDTTTTNEKTLTGFPNITFYEGEKVKAFINLETTEDDEGFGSNSGKVAVVRMGPVISRDAGT
ncbi:hypothetical protein CCR75_008897 [Bremia lactucae]|uniref:Uncharacterized protein n=1 Tax=Bremia lactucae TaxID=4779 RepID=A0A976NZR0_BRELC|nr:hypothetical protein CCR75_008897 [Bremia lactucae]